MSRQICGWRRKTALWGIVISVATIAATATSRADNSQSLTDARRLCQNGRYAESLEAYDALGKESATLTASEAVKLGLGRAECQASQGEYDTAIATIQSALETHKSNGDLLARLGELKLDRGDRDAADAAAAQALKASPDHLLARWVVARLLEQRGERDKAFAAWKWFVDHYNTNQRAVEKDAEQLLIVAQASEKYYRTKARGDELVDSLKDVFGLYEDALKADPHCWQAPWHEGQLFLSDYQEGKALKELTRALQINPMAAEVLVTLGQADLQGYRLAPGRAKAERALRVNPHCASAYILLADLNISDERFVDANDAAKKAVAENPKNEEALGRLAASCRLLVDPAGAAAAEAMALASNPRPAAFYASLGEPPCRPPQIPRSRARLFARRASGP